MNADSSISSAAAHDGPEQPGQYRILGTAGHIDHGKTSLIKALTGTDTDRLPEERRRGMTIELGFAELSLGDIRFGVVDVPGHERFVRTMVAGATGIDLALIVIAADDSIMPQTIEHVEILHLLGIHHAVVAIAKIDMVEREMVELVAEDVRGLLQGTPLQDAPICPVSSTTGEGLDALKHVIYDVAGKIERPPGGSIFRMAVDRVFTVAGRGTVVTGSALRGTVVAGDSLQIWPGGKTCRVRDLQTHGSHRDHLVRGQRAALNLTGVSREDLQRGVELATPGYLVPSHLLDVRLVTLSSLSRPLKSTQTVRLGIATMEVGVRVVLGEGRFLEPGQSGYAQLRSGEPITATYGQRFILRDETATRTIGGGIVLRPFARRRRSNKDVQRETLERLDRGDPAERVEDVLRYGGFVKPTELHICARAGVEPEDLPQVYEKLKEQKRWTRLPGTDVYAVPAAVDDTSQRLISWLERYHHQHRDQPGRHLDAVLGRLERMTSRTLARSLFELLLQRGLLKRLGSFVCLPAFAPVLSVADEKLLREVVEQIRAADFAPPTLDELAATHRTDRKQLHRLATLAVTMGELEAIDGKIYLAADNERRLREVVTGLIRREGSATVAQIREALRSSRKFVVPFVEYLDRVHVTKRVGDRRVLDDAGADSMPNGVRSEDQV